jgi:hypothetical protein
MIKKIISIITLVFFLNFTFSCVIRNYQRTEVEKLPPLQQGKEILTVRVEKKSGELPEFSKDRPARLVGDKIIVPSETRIQKDINKADIEKKYTNWGEATRVITKDGKIYEVLKIISETKDRLVIETYEPEGMIIPLSEVKLVWILKTNVFMTTLAIVLPIVVIGAVIAATLEFPSMNMDLSGMGGSCLFIYSFDGENYIFDAEPYGGAICQGLKRSEWCILENLEETNGQYQLLLRNELDETQYTDELKLVVVDHPAGIKIAPDESGRIHTLGNLQASVRAYEREGKDITQAVSENDHIFWQKTYAGRKRMKKEDLKEELIFEFPKPQHARKAKLFVHAGTELWGSQVAKTFLQLYGSELPQWYDEVNRLGPAFYRLWSWYTEEELYLLKIRVQTPFGWKTKGTIFGGGPFISMDKAYLIDISDVPGETLRIKLTPPLNFWRIDSIAVDYTEDQPLQVTEVAPSRAMSSRGQDVREALSLADNNFFIMPNREEFAELSYDSPPRLQGTKRTVLVKATGYYDVHLKSEGKKRAEVLGRIDSEPGFTLQFAYQTYLKAKKNQEKKIRILE